MSAFVPRPALFAGALMAAAMAALVSGPADAAVTMVGGGLGRECYLAAELRKDTRPSLDACSRALEAELLSRRDRAATHVNRGIIHMQARSLAEAISDYRQAIRIEPAMAEAHVNLGIALLHQGGHDREAIKSLTRGIEMKPVKPEIAHYTRAIAYELVGDMRQAYDDYVAAAALKPEWKEPAEQMKRFSFERRPTARG